MNKYYIYIILVLISFARINANENIEKAKKLYGQNRHKESIKILKQNLVDIVDSKDKELISQAYYGLGANYYNLGILDSSLKYLLVSENTNKESQNFKFSTLIFNELAVCLNEMGLHHEALYYLKKSLIINRSFDNKKGIILNLLNLGNTYYYLNNIDTSLTYYNEAASIIENRNSPQYMNLLNSLSVISARKGDYKTAIKTLKKVFDFKVTKQDSMRNYLYKTNLDMYLIADGQSPNNEQLLYDYLKYTKNNNETKNADAFFKHSIYRLYKGDFASALINLNNANSIYVSKKNLFKAKEITQYFKSVMEKLNIIGIKKIDNKLDQLNEQSIIQYSEALENEINIRLGIENEIINLENKLSYSLIGIEFLIALIIILCISIPLSIKYFLNERIFSVFKKGILEYNDNLKKIHDLKVKNSIGKMTNVMLLSKNINDDDILVKSLEDIIESSNELSIQINSINKLNWSKYVSNSSTNKLQLDR
jgi:tetratricopeptide (TPR) repeat protein